MPGCKGETLDGVGVQYQKINRNNMRKRANSPQGYQAIVDCGIVGFIYRLARLSVGQARFGVCNGKAVGT